MIPCTMCLINPQVLFCLTDPKPWQPKCVGNRDMSVVNWPISMCDSVIAAIVNKPYGSSN